MNIRIRAWITAALLIFSLASNGCEAIRKVFSSGGRDLPVEEYDPETGKTVETRPKKKKRRADKTETPAVAQPQNAKENNEKDKVFKKNWADRSRKTEAVLRAAQAYLNTPYKWGGTGKDGVDCSGLIVVAFRTVGVEPPRTSDRQAEIGKAVSRKELLPGDLLFFSASKAGVIGHTGLVVDTHEGKVKFIHATTSYGVRYDYLENDHWSPKFISARRYL